MLMLAAVLAGCGKAEHITLARRDAARARLAKALSECPIATLVKNREAEQRSALKSAEHLPRVVKLVADDAARLRVWVTLEQDGDFGSARGSKYINSYYRLNLKVY
jgi:hypothetical protein